MTFSWLEYAIKIEFLEFIKLVQLAQESRHVGGQKSKTVTPTSCKQWALAQKTMALHFLTEVLDLNQKKKFLDRLKEKFLTRLISLLYCLITQRLTTSNWHIFPKTIRTPVILMKAMIGNFLPLLRNLMFCWEIWVNLNLACQQNLILPQIGALSNLCTGWHKKVACQKLEQVLRYCL